MFHQFVVDGWGCVDQECLNWVCEHQKKIRAAEYNSVIDSCALNHAADITRDRIGKRLILPATHVGSDCHMHKLFQDSMAIVRFFGKPDLFITFTANPNWPEITAEGQTGTDRIDLVARVFNAKLKALLEDLRGGLFGKFKGIVRTTEFQKRGLPHAHILLFLDCNSKLNTPEKINKAVCAEIPDPVEQPALYETVTKHMMRSPCGELNPNAPCMKMDKCTGQLKWP